MKNKKQELEKEMFELEQELDIPSNLRWHNSKPKQETSVRLENSLKKFTINLDESWDLSDWLKQEKIEENNLSLDVRTTKNEIDFEFTLNEKPIAFFKFKAERLLEVLKKGTQITLKND